MGQEVFFSGIRSEILKNLDLCDYKIIIAVAWFTDAKLLNKINSLCKNGVEVEIIVYEDHVNKLSNFQKLYHNGAKIFFSKKLMHNKFCVIDDEIIINGSFNWTNNANLNDENISVIDNNDELVNKFTDQFEKIKVKCKDVSDRFDISNETIESLKWQIEKFIGHNSFNKYPYFKNIPSVKFNSEHEHYLTGKNPFRVGYYLIKNIDEEKSFLTFLYLLDTDLKLYKFRKFFSFDYRNLMHFDKVLNISQNKSQCYQLTKPTYLVEIHDHENNNKSFKRYHYNYLKEIDNNGNSIRSLRFNYKIPNNSYFRDLGFSGFKPACIFDTNFKTYELGLFDLKYDSNFGFVGNKKIKTFNEKKKIGLKGFRNEILIDFVYDHYETDSDNSHIIFYEFPLFYFDSEKPYLNYWLGHKGNFKQTTHKKSIYNYKTKSLDQELVKVRVDLPSTRKYFFYSDNNYKYKNFYAFLDYKLYYTLKYYDLNKLTKEDFNYFIQKIDEALDRGHSDVKDIIIRLDNSKDSFNQRYSTGKYAPKKKEGCYVATMVYGDYNHKNVILLRNFRDDFLLKFYLGKTFVLIYYKYSPGLVAYCNRNNFLHKILSFQVRAVVTILKL